MIKTDMYILCKRPYKTIQTLSFKFCLKLLITFLNKKKYNLHKIYLNINLHAL